MPKRKAALNPHEAAFVEAFLGPARGNLTKAAILAGYSRKTAGSQGSRLLKRVNVQKVLGQMLEQRKSDTIADAEERDKILSEFARDKRATRKERRQAIVELNRCEGRHSMTHVLKGRLTLEQALSKSREG